MRVRSTAAWRITARLRPSLWLKAAWVAAFFVLWLPAPVQIRAAGGDTNWHVGIVLALERHIHWGTQLAFTYGPLGSFETNQGFFLDGSNWLETLVFALAVHLGLVVGLGFFMASFRAPIWAWLALLLLFLFPLPITEMIDIEMLVLAIIVFTLAVRVERRGELLAILGGFIVAVELMAKGTSLVGATAIVGGFALAAWITGRRWLVVAAVVPALVAFLVLWLAAGQDPLTIPAYFRAAFEVIAGYSAAMSNIYLQPPDAGALRLVALSVVAISALEAFVAYRRRDRGALTLTLMSFPVTFLAYKEAFVRFKPIYFIFAALLLQALVAVALQNPGRRRTRARPASYDLFRDWPFLRPLGRMALPILGLAVVVSLNQWMIADAPAGHYPMPIQTAGQVVDNYRSAQRLATNPLAMRDLEARVRKQMRVTAAFPDAWLQQIGSATVDVLPWDLDLAYAYQLNWRPVPVLQSYVAYTPYLDDLDAGFLRGPDAPQFVIFAPRWLDDRYWMFDEPNAIRAMLERYRTIDSNSDWVFLRRQPDPCPCPERALGTRTVAVGETVHVPTASGSRVFARIHIDQSILGRAANVLLDPGAVRVDLAGPGGSMTYRLVTATAADGVLLSSYTFDPPGTAIVWSGCDLNPVDTVAVHPDEPLLYGSQVTYEFYAQSTGGGCKGPP